VGVIAKDIDGGKYETLAQVQAEMKKQREIINARDFK
jgi:hypothetical protein